MQKLIFSIVMAAAFFGNTAWAAKATPNHSCKAMKWPFSRKQKGEDYQKLFLLTPRHKLESFYLGELTNPKLEPSELTYDLARFLIDSESNKPKRDFFEVLRWGSELHSKKDHPRTMKLEKVCEIRRKLLGKK